MFKKAPSNCGIQVVKDPRSILACVLLSLGVLVFWILWVVGTLRQSSTPENEPFILISIVAITLTAVSVKRCQVMIGGYVVDSDNDILEVPGGGIAPNEVGDYVSPTFLLQKLRRFTYKLSDVREIRRREGAESVFTGKRNGKVKYTMMINGAFGSMSLPFSSREKRDELFSALRQANKMGAPWIID